MLSFGGPFYVDSITLIYSKILSAKTNPNSNLDPNKYSSRPKK